MSTHSSIQLFSTWQDTRELLSANRELIKKANQVVADGGNRVQSIVETIKVLENYSHVRKSATQPSKEQLEREKINSEEIAEHMLLHDIRGSMMNIISLIQLIRRSETLSDKGLHYVNLLESQSLQVQNQTQFYTLYQQLESGEYQPKDESFNLIQTFSEIKDSVYRQCSSNPIELGVDDYPIESCEEFNVRADSVLIKLMLQNLVQNAVEASPPQSPIQININRQIHVDDEISSIGISIHNQGTIPTAIQNRFFEKFATHGKSEGTGLGTYIAKLAAQAFGGTITFTTSEKQGTTLRVHLPNLEVSCLPALQLK